MFNFSEKKAEFESIYLAKKNIDSIVNIHLTQNKNVNLFNSKGQPNEEFFKWELVYSLINSGLVPKDYIGTEIYFPKGNKNSNPIKFDIAIFSSADWFDYYKDFHENDNQSSLEWLRNNLIVVGEIKKENSKDTERVYNQQLKPAMKESERDFCLGVLYDSGRLYLFKREKDKFLRLNDEYNTKGEKSTLKELSLHLTDPYKDFPKFDDIVNWKNNKTKVRSELTIDDLDVISGIQSTQINDVMSNILRVMEARGLVNQRGYEILIQIMALKIFDEKRNENNPNEKLKFYIEDNEMNFTSLNDDEEIHNFLDRIDKLKSDAEGTYYRIMNNEVIYNRTSENHIRMIIEVVRQFQNYSFVRSQKTDLYQLVFYKFATPFSKDQNAQFVTPLPLIEFLVNIVNPRSNETVIDPTVGIADFLSVSYVNSNSKLNDDNMFGIDIDEQMVMLATLNMLLNGDGNAKIIAKPGYGSISHKFSNNGELIELATKRIKKHYDATNEIDWEQRGDGKKLKKFDVVLTNPPFGEDRAFRPESDKDYELIESYELWHKARAGDWIDLGIVFLENTVRILKENGRFGIVLSNSIASIDRWEEARKWLLDNVRVVGIFDLPANVFAETGVNTTIIVGYKPSKKELKKLKNTGYEIFSKNIENVGYEVKTSKRVKKFEKVFKINMNTFELEIDEQGANILDEDFTQTVKDFKNWCLSQEKNLIDLFIKER